MKKLRTIIAFFSIMISSIVAESTFRGFYAGLQAAYTQRNALAFGIRPRFGKIIDESFLIYGKLGLELSRDKASHAIAASFAASPPRNLVDSYMPNSLLKSSPKTKIVVVPSLGLEKAFGTFLTRLEYGFNPSTALRQNNSYTQKQIGAGINFKNTNSQRLSYKQHIVKFAAVYKF